MPADEVLAEVEAWIAKADEDMRAAELLLGAADAGYAVVCFHAQQAAEKYLKAALTFCGQPFPRTHDLSVLLLLLPDHLRLPDQLGDLSELSDAAVTSRYPADMVEYDRTAADALVQQALAVRLALMDRLVASGFPSAAD